MVIGCLVAQRLYGITIPIMVTAIEGIATGDILGMSCDVDGDSVVDCSNLGTEQL